jgi:hypothetical protein
MKNCPVCALDVEDTYLFCPEDGSSLRTLSSGLPENESTSAPELSNPQQPQPSSSQECEAESSYPTLAAARNERGFERPDLRVAAIATVIALAVFALVATYAFVSSVSRRPSASVERVAVAAEATPQSLPLVPTPQEARDYEEKQPAPVASTPHEPPAEGSLERKSYEPVSVATTERSVRNTVTQPLKERSAAKPSQTQAAMTKVSSSPMPALPRGNSGGFDARLIHVRSRRTSSGFRYDLTFNMQEQVGRASQWQRLLITTRSASGMSHSEAIPFLHRLGATGSLSFTISVELTGRSEADRQGRIVCTTLGWDNTGAPLQASFGANVAP